MVYSAEVRWFFGNKTDVAVIEAWFNTHQQFFANKWSRADIYLWQPDLHTHSVKIREGKVEVKVLLQDRGVVSLPDENTGIANDWVKYSFELKENEEENTALLQQFNGSAPQHKEYNWLKVDKERLLVKFALHYDPESITTVAADAWPHEGCGVELTRIKINHQEYFTFGLEAFSKTRQEYKNLEQVVNHIMPQLKGINLNFQQSHAYPEFLASLSQS